MDKAAEDDARKKNIIETEINILKRVSHDHVVKMIEIFETEDKIILVLQL